MFLRVRLRRAEERLVTMVSRGLRPTFERPAYLVHEAIKRGEATNTQQLDVTGVAVAANDLPAFTLLQQLGPPRLPVLWRRTPIW